MMRSAALTLALTLLAAPAVTGDRTSVPTWLRGDIHIGYAGNLALVGLEDRTEPDGPLLEAGRYVANGHAIRLGGAFSVYHGIAIRLDVPIYFDSRVRWLRANELRYTPEFDRPTAAETDALPQDVLDGSSSSRVHNGFGDLTLGFRVVPFAQRGVPHRVAPASLAVDLDVVFPSGGNHDKVRDNESAGPGVGGMQVRLGVAASRRLGTSEPYLGFAWTHRAPYRVDLAPVRRAADPDVEEDGRTKLDPADEVELRFGAEIIAAEDHDADTSIRLDVGMGVTYVSPGEVASGTRLPAPLDPTVGHAAITSEHVVLDAALGLRIRPRSQVELRVDYSAGWLSPHLLEQVDHKAYGVRTSPSSFVMQLGVGVAIRLR